MLLYDLRGLDRRPHRAAREVADEGEHEEPGREGKSDDSETDAPILADPFIAL